MDAQVDRGHDVGYFFSGRHYARPSRPRLKRWEQGGVAMHEVINGPIVSGLELGTRYPELDLDEPTIEAFFRSVLRSFRPDVVHVQELLCLPSSLMDVAAGEGVGTVMTLQDYLPLCSTLRLFDADGRVCTRLDVGKDCAVRNATAPPTRKPFVEDTLHFEIPQWRRRLRIRPGRMGRIFDEELVPRVFDWSMRAVARERPRVRPPTNGSLAEAFQRRRDGNVERLGRVGRLVAQSARVAEIYEARGVSPERMTAVPFTLAHIERLRPRSLGPPPSPITFATLGGCASPTKGSEVVVGALRTLREAGLEGQFRLLVFGGVHDDVRAYLEAYRGVEVPELYGREQLDTLLDDVDVGIMPSIWEEALGYSGVEMIAKAIPLIANPLGGIVEYAWEGETAWLNKSCSGEGLAELMSKLIADPGEVVEMHARVLAARDQIVRPMAEHVDAMEGIYRGVR
jgi:glycosyltransferase involved in cell wall biosynthesis